MRRPTQHDVLGAVMFWGMLAAAAWLLFLTGSMVYDEVKS